MTSRRLAYAQSPHKYLNKIALDTQIVALTGSEDDNTLPSNARDYVARAKKRGLDAEFVFVEGAGHDFGRRLGGAALAAVAGLLGTAAPAAGTPAGARPARAAPTVGEPSSTTVESLRAMLDDLRDWPPDSAEVPPRFTKEWGGNAGARDKYARLFDERGALESIQYLETFRGLDVYWVRFENARLLVRYARDGSGMLRTFRSTPFGLPRN